MGSRTRLHLWACLLLLAVPLTPLFAAAAPQAAAQPPNAAGTVVLVEGDVRIVSAGAPPHAVKLGDVVSEGDVLITGQVGEVHLKMQDTGFIALRPATRLKVVSYKADGGDDDNAVLRLVQGGFRSVTGWIGKFNRAGYKVRTPTATIGVRGTDHEPRYIPEGSAEGEPGTYDRVYVGESVIEGSSGEALVAPKQAGFASDNPRTKPRLLASIPKFFKPSPYEAEIAKKHAEIQLLIDQRRQERQKVIAEKRAALQESRAQGQALMEQNKEAIAQQKQAAEEQRKEAQEKREALQRDTQAATDMRTAVQEKRKALEADIQSGTLTVKQVQERRKALREASQAAERAWEDIKRRRRQLQQDMDARVDSRAQAAQERLDAAKNQRQDLRGKRKSLEDEQDSTQQEMKTLRQQENQRYREELKDARKKAQTPPDAGKDDKQDGKSQ